MGDDPDRGDESRAPDEAAGNRSIDPELLELDVVFDALDQPRRRYLCYLLRQDPAWSLPELAARIASLDRDVPEDEVDPSHGDRVELMLAHSHVPALAEMDVVDYDEDSNRVRRGENFELVSAALEGLARGLDVGST